MSRSTVNNRPAAHGGGIRDSRPPRPCPRPRHISSIIDLYLSDLDGPIVTARPPRPQAGR
jgi:hypothetical protein